MSPPSLPSDDEKKLGVEPGEVVESGANDGLPPDPDAGLSEEDRAAIVRAVSIIPSAINEKENNG